MLEKFDNQHEFERMCADILNALGYKDVVLIAPRGGSDGGMDITFSTENGGKGLACVTLRKDIEVKFKQDFSQRTVGEYEKYVLFCNYGKLERTSTRLQYSNVFTRPCKF